MSNFKRISKISEAFDNSISKLSSDELRKLIGECRNLSTTNCWFLLYEMRDVVIDRAKAFLRTRRIKAGHNKKRGD